MGKFVVVHEIQCDLETFWKTFLEKDFNTKLYSEVLGFPDWRILEQTEDDQQIVRKVSGSPKMDVPGPVAKLIGPGFRYTEEGKLDKAKWIFRWKLQPSTLADKLFTSGTVRAERIGDTKTRRIAEMTVEAKIFGLGGLIESTMEKQLRQGWDRSGAYMNKYLADRAQQK